jgi:hypothetical protein
VKLTANLMMVTGECIKVCDARGIDPRLVARVLLGVVDWETPSPELEPGADDDEYRSPVAKLLDEEPRSRFRSGPVDPVRPWERYSKPEAEPAQEAPPTAPWDEMELVPRPLPPLVPQPADGERDAKGRKVVKRDHNWRENTLQHMQVGESALMSYLLEQLPGVSRGAMAQRMAMLVAEGHLEQIGPGSWRRIK